MINNVIDFCNIQILTEDSGNSHFVTLKLLKEVRQRGQQPPEAWQNDCLPNLQSIFVLFHLLYQAKAILKKQIKTPQSLLNVRVHYFVSLTPIFILPSSRDSWQYSLLVHTKRGLLWLWCILNPQRTFPYNIFVIANGFLGEITIWHSVMSLIIWWRHWTFDDITMV